jgi:hypothetical protein
VATRRSRAARRRACVRRWPTRHPLRPRRRPRLPGFERSPSVTERCRLAGPSPTLPPDIRRSPGSALRRPPEGRSLLGALFPRPDDFAGLVGPLAAFCGRAGAVAGFGCAGVACTGAGCDEGAVCPSCERIRSIRLRVRPASSASGLAAKYRCAARQAALVGPAVHARRSCPLQ